MKCKPLSKALMVLIVLALVLAPTGLADRLLNIAGWGTLGEGEGAEAGPVGGFSSTDALSLESSSQAASRLARQDYQTFYDEAQALLARGIEFRSTEITVPPVGDDYGTVITDILKNYQSFNGGALFYAFCADYDAIDQQGYCPDQGGRENVRNKLIRARELFAVMSVADPANTAINAGGQTVNVRSVGRTGVLSATREIAYVHMIFGNEFLVDASDFRFSVVDPSSKDIITEELGQLELARQQFALAVAVLAHAFTADIGGPHRTHIGDYFGPQEFELFGMASERLVMTLDEMAKRHRILGEDERAVQLYVQGFNDQYLLTLALAQKAAQQGVGFLEHGGWEMMSNLERLSQQARAIQEGLDPFGYKASYVPLQTFDDLLELTWGPTGDTGLLGDAEEDELAAAASQREFDHNRTQLNTELLDLRDRYGTQLFELCGESDDNYATCASGLMRQNYYDMLAAAKSTQLAWQRAINVVQQIEIEEERAGQVIDVILGTGKQIAAIELAIGKLEAYQETVTMVDSTTDTWYQEEEHERREYKKHSSTLSWNPLDIVTTLTGGEREKGVEESFSEKEGYRHEQSRTTSVERTWNPNAELIGVFNSIRALAEAEAQAQIEGANSAAVIKNLLLEQSELLIEHELAVMEWNKLSDEHNHLVERFHNLLNLRAMAQANLLDSYVNNPAYRIQRDSLTLESVRSLNLAAQYAYLTAKAFEYDFLTPFQGVSGGTIDDIFIARTADDVDNFLLELEATKLGSDKPGAANHFPRSISLAEDLLGLTDENLDPSGVLSETERAQLRYELFQEIVQDHIISDTLSILFTTSLLNDQLFSPNIWNNRISRVGEYPEEGCPNGDPCQGVAINILTRQSGDLGTPEVKLTHAGQATYRNSTGKIVEYDPGPAVPVGHKIPEGLASETTTAVILCSVNGDDAGTPSSALFNLSVAASKWTLKIDTHWPNNRGLDLTQLEDIEIRLDTTGRAIQGRELAAETDARRMQAEFSTGLRQPERFDAYPTEMLERWRCAPATPRVASAAPRLLETPPLLGADVLSGTIFGTLSITEPVNLGTTDLAFDLTDQDGVLSGTIKADDTLLFSGTLPLHGSFDGTTFTIQSDVFEWESGSQSRRWPTVSGRSPTAVTYRQWPRSAPAQRQFSITGQIYGRVLKGEYTEVITNFASDPITVCGLFQGSLQTPIVVRDATVVLQVETESAHVPLNGSTAISATLLNSLGQTMAETDRITFTSDLGTVTPPAMNAADGVALATFTAGNTPGWSTITATNGIILGTSQVKVVGEEFVFLPIVLSKR